MKVSILALIAIIGFCLSFMAGSMWNKGQYDDLCINMGGSLDNPKSMCVIKAQAGQPETFTLNEESQKLVGPWMVSTGEWGFNLFDDGTASSINSATLIYQKWRIEGKQLCLTVRSLGNRTQSVDEECSPYETQGAKGDAKIILTNNSLTTIYRRP
jgi:hypothetical protein